MDEVTDRRGRKRERGRKKKQMNRRGGGAEIDRYRQMGEEKEQTDGQTETQTNRQTGGLPSSLAMTVTVVSLIPLKGLASRSSTVLAARALIPDDIVLWTLTVVRASRLRHRPAFSL